MFCEACRSMLAHGSVLCDVCGHEQRQAATTDVRDRAAAAAEASVVMEGPTCPDHAGMPLVGTCPRCKEEVCIRCAPDALFDRFTCTDCAGLTAAHTSAPEGARCGVHPSATAAFICARCGTFSCGACAHPASPGQCLACAPHISHLASRGERLAAHLIDHVFVIGVMMVFAFAGVLTVGETSSELGAFPFVFAIGVLVGLGGQIAAQVRWRQSLGKRLMGIQVVRLDGSPVDFWRLLFLRNVVLTVVAQFCGLVSLIDALWIFGDQKRCIHDYLADTMVVDVAPKPAPAPAPATQPEPGGLMGA